MVRLAAFAIVFLWTQEDTGARVKQTAYARGPRATAIAGTSIMRPP